MEGLPRDALVHTLHYLDATDMRAVALVSRRLHDLQQTHPVLWEALFRLHWNVCNFFMDPSRRIELSPAVGAAYSNPSDAFRFLTHCLQRVPSFADIYLTNAHATSSLLQHRIEPVAYDNGQVVTLALAKGTDVGGNRCVRANMPFDVSPRVSVMCTSRNTWLVDVLYDGYFEISISDACTTTPDAWDHQADKCIAIGVATAAFEVVDQQPGWDDHSYGYHSDDGQFFTDGQPRPFAATFGVHDTIGCGVERNMVTHGSTLYFTKNGVRLDGTFPCNHEALYPVVGLDADYTVRLNCGQMPFECPPPPSAASVEALEELQAQPWAPCHQRKSTCLITQLWRRVQVWLSGGAV
ncbi:Aste57867_22532 [Aphanomyces stellatus]|uniref:Aste57867_22532 protein n=1 Tax=Aphanomyces stellatus TaxID=120398 RepID=A0A485LKI1_9STRA|nr:hypothetical protein As57867_022462 [Aphanomyces stellatus]VFT99192.1 Aste57867_22532 [Aphanomyces stellatus]